MLQRILKDRALRIFVIIWSTIASLHYLQFSLQYIMKGRRFPWLPSLLEFLVNYYIWVPLAALVKWLGQRFPIQKKQLGKNLSVHLTASLLVAAFHVGVIAAGLKFFKGFEFRSSSIADLYQFVFLQLFHFEVLVYWAVLGLSLGLLKKNSAAAIHKNNRHHRFLTRVPLKENGRTIILDLTKAERLEAADNYVKIYTGSGAYLLRERLSTLEEKLDPARFQRIHRSAIVNLARLKEIRRGCGGNRIAVLQSGATLPVSRRRHSAFSKALETALQQ